MNDNEANKVIAEYMNRVTKSFGNSSELWFNEPTNMGAVKYSKSLDVLVPVWEKLGDLPISISRNHFKDDNSYCCELSNRKYEIIAQIYGSTAQQAAAHSTAKAILALSVND